MVKEQLQSPQDRLSAATKEDRDVGRAKQPVSLNRPENLDVAWHQGDRSNRRAIKARQSDIAV